MTHDELKDALDGLYAYDGGAIDSGIHDELLRRRCLDQLAAGDTAVLIAQLAEELYGRPPYTEEDVEEFTEWLTDQL